MSSPALISVGRFIRDLMGYDEQLVRLGRENFGREQFETAYVVVDGLGPFMRVAQFEEYNGTTESMQYGTLWRGTVTLDFYGAGAYNRAADFGSRMRSQAAAELKKTYAVNMYGVKSLTDLKAMTGQQYGERVQTEMTVELTTTSDVPTLRIDTAQLEIRNEQGVQYNG